MHPSAAGDCSCTKKPVLSSERDVQARMEKVTHSIAVAVAVIFLLSFSAQKSHVKPSNHLTHYQPTTSVWHFSYSQPAILDIEIKTSKPRGDTYSYGANSFRKKTLTTITLNAPDLHAKSEGKSPIMKTLRNNGREGAPPFDPGQNESGVYFIRLKRSELPNVLITLNNA